MWQQTWKNTQKQDWNIVPITLFLQTAYNGNYHMQALLTKMCGECVLGGGGMWGLGGIVSKVLLR
jgi:hypothetical protein